MMNNSKRRTYRSHSDAKHKLQCNRLMAKAHLNNSIALIVLFVSVFLFPYQVLAGDIVYSAIDENLTPHSVVQITEEKAQRLQNIHENNTTNTENSTSNIEYAGFVDIVFPHPLHEDEVTSSIPPPIKEEHVNSFEHTVDLNNDILTNLEERAENKLYPDFVISERANATLTENLEESIRNSVRTEIEQEPNLESSPVLEILKDLPEADIRKTLADGIMSFDQEILDKHGMVLLFADEEKSEPEPMLEVEFSKIKSLTPRDGRHLEIQQPQLNSSVQFLNSMEAENSSAYSKVANPEQILTVNSSLTFSSENNSSERTSDNIKKKGKTFIENVNGEEEVEDVDLTVAETSYELQKVNSPSSDFPILIADETDDSALSVVLNETYSALESYSGEESPIRIEENVELTTEEQVESITVLPEESEHIVVKKVLDIQGIFEDISETTLIPLYQAQTTIPQTSDFDEQSLVKQTQDDYVKTKIYDTQNHELNTKAEDRNRALNSNERDHEAYLEHEQQEQNGKADENETKLEHEDQNPELSREADDHKTKPEPENQNPELNSSEGDYEAKLMNENLELNSKAGDHETKLEHEDQTPDLNSKEQDHETKLQHEDQNRELNSNQGNYEAKLLYENQELNSTANDHETKLEHEYQNPELNRKTNDYETKLEHEDRNAELNSKDDDHETKLEHEVQSSDIYKENSQRQSYSENEKEEETKLQQNKESQNLPSHLQLTEHTENPLNSDNKSSYDKAATFFEAYLPRDSGQTFNNNLADEFAGIGKALPMSINDGSNRSTVIIVLSSGTALLFVVISITIFLISFQRQHGTLDIEMQERSCGKDDLDEEDVETFSKLLAVELPPSVSLALDDTEECL